MKSFYALVAGFLIGLTGCEHMTGVDESLLSSVQRLNSPDNRFSFYKYVVDPSMAFGSGSIRMQIIRSDESFDCTYYDFFMLKGSPIVETWVDNHTLRIKVQDHGPCTEKEPYARDTMMRKGFSIEIEHYHEFGSGNNYFTFNAYRVQGDTIWFLNDGKTACFVKGRDEITYDSGHFSIDEIKATMDSTGRYLKKGIMVVMQDNWQVTPKGRFDFSSFLKNGVFMEVLKKKE